MLIKNDLCKLRNNAQTVCLVLLPESRLLALKRKEINIHGLYQKMVDMFNDAGVVEHTQNLCFPDRFLYAFIRHILKRNSFDDNLNLRLCSNKGNIS